MNMASSRPIPEVDILLLGSPGTGKSTFLQSLPRVRDGALQNLPTRIDLAHWPATFSVSLYNRPYSFRVWASTSTLFTDPFPPEPSVAVITYAIDDRVSLQNARDYWHKQLVLRHADETPVILLGLKRDLRSEERDGETGEYLCVMPDEGVRAATQMRCDKYAECSALTGELLWEVLEDITKVAAKTTIAGGVREEMSCAVM